MRSFRIHLRSGEVVTVIGDRLWTSRDHENPQNEAILEVIVDTPMKEHPDKTSAVVVAVFPLSQVKAAYEGKCESEEIHPA